MKLEFNKRDVWTTEHETFCVEVSRHDQYEDNNGWCIYVYVRPDHPMFEHLTSEDYYKQNIINNMPLHFGCTYHNIIYSKNGNIKCHKIGADYSHLYDDFIQMCKTKDEAMEVFDDAASLVNYMNDWSKRNEQTHKTS